MTLSEFYDDDLHQNYSNTREKHPTYVRCSSRFLTGKQS